MRVLLLNGSPRREKSCTIRVAHKFVDGLRAAGDCEVEEINISDCRITPCLGCLSLVVGEISTLLDQVKRIFGL